VGDVVKVKVVSIMPFGAFAEIIKGIDGLIHISQLSLRKVANVKDVLAVGDEADAKITEIDVDKKRVSLSIRALAEESAADILAESEGARKPAEETESGDAPDKPVSEGPGGSAPPEEQPETPPESESDSDENPEISPT
jgi:4-hydroxy-3-methylbut-2-enyl diphosphate reductase